MHSLKKKISKRFVSWDSTHKPTESKKYTVLVVSSEKKYKTDNIEIFVFDDVISALHKMIDVVPDRLNFSLKMKFLKSFTKV